MGWLRRRRGNLLGQTAADTLEEQPRDADTFRWLGDVEQDVRYAIRTLRKAPSFALVAVLTLALGIGATTAIYSVVDTILLQPLPFADSDHLVRVVENIPFIDAGRPPVHRGVTYQEFLDWRSRTRTLSDTVAVIGLAQRTARTGNGTARLWGAMTSGHAFTLFSIAALTSVVFGVLPALHLSRTNHLHAMGSRGGGSGRGESRIRAALVVGQLVMATVLLVCAGLLIHSFARLTAVETGFNPSNVLALQLVFPADYSITRKAGTIESLLTRLRAVPNVESAGFSRAGILIGEELNVGTFVPKGRTLAEMRAEPARPRVRSVSEGYLTTMGVRVLEGRELEATDTATAPPVIVINRTVARRYFGAGSPVGQFVDWYPNKGPAYQVQVVGVVEDVRNTTPDREAFPEVFVDYRQLLSIQQKWGDSTQQQDVVAIGFLSFAIRTRGDPASAIPAVGRIVRSVDPNAGIESILPMDRLVASNVARQRFYAVMLGVFAGVAAVLAAIGIYGVLAYAVIQRTQEIGIRMALGAQRAQVLALVLRKGVILTTIGVALGLVGAAAGTRFLQGMLFGITPLDPKTFMAVSLMFGLVATFASYVPARRATKVDPMVALRSE